MFDLYKNVQVLLSRLKYLASDAVDILLLHYKLAFFRPCVHYFSFSKFLFIISVLLDQIPLQWDKIIIRGH